MDDDSKFGNAVKLGLGAVGLGAVAAAFALPRPMGIWVAVAILVLFVVFLGGYFLWRKMRARKQSRAFSSAIAAQTTAAPKAISDPNQRAALDKLRQKFQSGMQEFKSRGKDIYKLPWHVIIGESGSGKSEAIRHSGIEFPPGLQDEMQGSGGTVNMDWWFTNRGIILDTAGSMIFSETRAGESPEWPEFLRLLKKSRPHCPINGLFLVLSIESLIKDSADKIAEKASRLAQQLDLIQRTLDVRFPVYLLVTKADLLTGFREFFDNIDDPLLQHQMFGWSNPDPLDSHFRPDLVEQHLKSVADRLRRRRMALMLRETTASPSRMGETAFFTAASTRGQRRLDEVDSMFALPESVMRLVPRLRRYLETVFVAGEWSAKPVFLRGIYFTSSMREGKALDEAIAMATGVSVDQLPEDRSWEKNRAFFLRDLFVEKVFRESGLVTRATNTIQLLRKRRLAIFGSAGVALVLLTVFAGFGYSTLKRSVLQEAAEWEAGARAWNQGVWTLPIVRAGSNGVTQFSYVGNTQEVEVGNRTISLIEYQRQIQEVASRPLAVSLVFKPLTWFGFGEVRERQAAQLKIFEHGVLKPLVEATRAKMSREPDTAAVVRHQNALLSLIQLQADAASDTALGTNAAPYLSSLLAYLTETDTVKLDTNLVEVFSWTYSRSGGGNKKWPPEYLVDSIKNPKVLRGINDGMEGLRKANVRTEVVISNRLAALNGLTASFLKYRETEQKLLASAGNVCGEDLLNLSSARRAIERSVDNLYAQGGNLGNPLTNLTRCYDELAAQAASASALGIERNLHLFPESFRAGPLYQQIDEQLKKFKQAAAGSVTAAKSRQREDLTSLDRDYLTAAPGTNTPSYELRWALLYSACSLLTNSAVASDEIIGNMALRFGSLTTNAQYVTSGLQTYTGPFAEPVHTVCTRTIGQNVEQLKKQFVENYSRYVRDRLGRMKFPLRLDSSETLTGPELLALQKGFFTGLGADLNSPIWETFPASVALLQPLRDHAIPRVAQGLVTPDQTLGEVEIVFTPPQPGAGDVGLYSGFLRYAKVFVDGVEKFNQDLSRFARDPVSVATKIPVSANVRIEFYSDVNRTRRTAEFGEDNWLLARLIRNNQVQRLRELEWKLNLPTTIGGTAKTLEAFQFRVSGALPKREDWPK